MVTVRFTSHLRQHLSSPECRVEASQVREALNRVFDESPKLRGYVIDDQDQLRKHVAVFLNGALVRDRHGLSDPVKAGDEIYVMQALSGG